MPNCGDRFEPAINARWALIRAAAAAFPGLAVMEAGRRDVWLQLMRGTVELAPLIEPVLPSGDDDELDEHRNRALLELARHLGARFATS